MGPVAQDEASVFFLTWQIQLIALRLQIRFWWLKSYHVVPPLCKRLAQEYLNRYFGKRRCTGLFSDVYWTSYSGLPSLPQAGSGVRSRRPPLLLIVSCSINTSTMTSRMVKMCKDCDKDKDKEKEEDIDSPQLCAHPRALTWKRGCLGRFSRSASAAPEHRVHRSQITHRTQHIAHSTQHQSTECTGHR